MKRIIIILLLASFSTTIYSQEEIIGHSFYDRQTNGASQNRVYFFSDGTIGTSWTQSYDPYTYPDRGTGYNYFNGANWQPIPTERIESMRCGWPSYAPLGENGELIVSHLSYADTVGLLLNRRENKGDGDWVESLFLGPTGHEEVFWPRMVTGGENHTSVYILALTAPVANGGDIYQGLDGALLYSRSTNSGETWDIQNQILPGMDSTAYNGFPGDCYAFAEPKDSIVAFVTGSPKTDLFLMKSTDLGQTFEKTIIWDNPYDTILPADTFYCVDGSLSVTLDISGKAHVVFGIVSAYYNNEWGTNRNTDGIGYWNEDRVSFSSDDSALNPEGGAGSEMIPDYNLIGWSQDITGDGELNFLGIALYGGWHGLSSMPQIIIDDVNRIFVCYTSVTEIYENGLDNYRRLWFRSSENFGNTWNEFYHYGGNDSIHIFDDFMFPSCASYSDENIYCIFLTGNEPGLSIYGESDEYNSIWFVATPKDEIVGIKTNKTKTLEFEVSQNFPNPFSTTTNINVKLEKPIDLKLDIINLLGENIYQVPSYSGNTGLNTFTIYADNFVPGIYFYTIQAGESTITKKMIVK